MTGTGASLPSPAEETRSRTSDDHAPPAMTTAVPASILPREV